ncbi:MBL fold metallo-hydrolase [Cellulomonas bogoriensis]|uniref:Metal-dependent hydrolase n=1 Tax=Cellulomonas bogoriensis 69B4 = DSM 16987 TaxID=1386082 RepID=A0A0A0C169_9CELL|nr:MBL fold metallo-hydrolase [Cellulomonas bogoriensis]KGM13930.1 metal-dependent hydrolase [Cellulomonas bogoriensis 69B4 = DSM 16987]
MRVTVVGCAGSFPGPESAASSYLVQAEDEAGRTWNVLLDLGSGALGALQRFCPPTEVDALGLSHLHPDHVADVSGLYVYLKYRPIGTGPGRRRPLPVHGPFGTASRLGQAYGLEPGESMADQLAVHAWQPGRPVRVGPMSLTPVAVNHPVPAYGIRVQGPSEDDPSREVTLAYTGDTDTCPGLSQLAAGVDVLLAEASFVEGRDPVRDIHLTGRRAGEVAAEGGVGRLVLTHIPAWNPPGAAHKEASAVFDGPIEVARPGLVVRL